MGWIFPLFTVLLIVSLSDAKGISYPKEECDWIGADRMPGPRLPIGVCKHIFNPYNLSTHVDDHRYSQKYMCSDDGSTVHNLVFQNNSNCEGDYATLPAKIYDDGDDYFGCNHGTCPYSVIRFHHRMPSNDTCGKSDDGWYSEAPNNVYQCLNNSKGWFMLECTPDGRGIIGVEYTENCDQILNETVLYDGCTWPDKYIEITHCDYWEDGARQSSTSTTGMSTTNAPISAVSTALGMDGSGCGEGHMHHKHHGHHSHSGSRDEHEHHHHHHDHDSPRNHDTPAPRKSESVSWVRWFVVASGCGLLFIALCVCMTYKYWKQKQQIAVFKVLVNEQYNDTAETAEDGEATTICLDEGDAITFK